MISSKKTTLKTSLLALLFFLVNFCHGQNTTLQYVPSDAPFVLSMNLGNLGKRVNLNNLKQYDFYKSLIKEMENAQLEDTEKKYIHAFLDSPESLGFDMLRPFYFFVKESGDTTFYTMVMEMGNRAKYESGLMELFPEQYDEHLTQKDDYLIWQNGTETYVWNDDVILNIWSQYTPNFEDLFSEENGEWEEYEWPEEENLDSTYSESDDAWVAYPPLSDTTLIQNDSVPFPIDSLREELEETFENTDASEDFGIWGVDTRQASANWADQLMNRQIGIPLSTNAQFKNAKAQNADLHFWMDYNYFLNEYKNTTQGFGGMTDDKMAPFVELATGMVYEMYGNSYLSWGLSFEQGKMAIRSQQFFNQKMKNFFTGVKKVKFNKKFFRYVEGGDDLFGYAYFNFNIKNAIDEGRTLMHDLLRSDPKYGLAASDAMKIFGIFIDEDAIANLFKGDMMLSFSGMQTIEVSETTYDFDEDFNYIEKDTIVSMEVPNVIALATFGNKENIQKFIDFGIHSEGLKKEGNLYRIDEPTSGVSFYLAVEKKMLILSNNREQLINSLSSGISKNKRLGKKHRKKLCENSSVVYWDVPNTKRQTAKNDGSTNFGPMYYVDVFGKQFESLEWKSSKKVEGSLNSEFNVNFKNQETNSLEQFFIFINDIFLEFEGGAKI